jgi:tetratricopeptide (TPR) repeat protein
MQVRCTISHKLGAAYVHCLEGEDFVGPATHMHSYTWGYTTGDIIDTLVAFCQRHNLNSKRTYFWICFLCVNQHEIVECLKNETCVPTKLFVDTFQKRVFKIGQIVCMMAPWEKPTYLSRVWCIFEMAAAFSAENCKVMIAMPPEEENKRLEEQLGREDDRAIDAFYKALANTKVQNAQATIETDQQHILNVVKEQFGSFHAMNVLVNECLCKWVKTTLEALVKQYQSTENCQAWSKVEEESDLLAKAKMFSWIGEVFYEHREYDAGLDLHKQALSIHEWKLGKDHTGTATTYNNIGDALYCKGDYEAALVEYLKALTIQEASFGKDHPKTAMTYNKIGNVLSYKGDYEAALAEYHKALAI